MYPVIQDKTFIDPYIQQLNVVKDWEQELAQYEVTQVTLTNLTGEQQSTVLWQKNTERNSTASVSTANEFYRVDNYPQAIAYNPFNDKLYVAHQLEGTVWVLDGQGNKETTLALAPSFSGFNSPVSIAVNPQNGTVYIAGSIANSITAFQDGQTSQPLFDVTVGNRPKEITYNPVNRKLYVTHIVSAALTILDADSGLNSGQIDSITSIVKVVVNAFNGEWYLIHTSGIVQYNAQNEVLQTATIDALNIGQPISAIFNEQTAQLIIGTQDNKIILFKANQLTIENQDELNHQPNLLQYIDDEGIGYCVSAQQGGQDLFIKNLLTGSSHSMEVSLVNYGLAYHPNTRCIYLTHPTENRLEVVKWESQSTHVQQTITYSDDYFEIAEDFRYNPAFLKHVKLYTSGTDFYPIIRVGNQTPGGKSEQWTLSLENHRNPKNCLRLAELFEFENETIDSHSRWELHLAPYQRMTFILYYRQCNREQLNTY